VFLPWGMAGRGSVLGRVEEGVKCVLDGGLIVAMSLCRQEVRNEDRKEEKWEEMGVQPVEQKVWILYPSELPLQSHLTESAIQSCAGFFAEYMAYIEPLW
jgi:hypothetical protein